MLVFRIWQTVSIRSIVIIINGNLKSHSGDYDRLMTERGTGQMNTLWRAAMLGSAKVNWANKPMALVERSQDPALRNPSVKASLTS